MVSTGEAAREASPAATPVHPVPETLVRGTSDVWWLAPTDQSRSRMVPIKCGGTKGKVVSSKDVFPKAPGREQFQHATMWPSTRSVPGEKFEWLDADSMKVGLDHPKEPFYKFELGRLHGVRTSHGRRRPPLGERGTQMPPVVGMEQRPGTSTVRAMNKVSYSKPVDNSRAEAYMQSMFLDSVLSGRAVIAEVPPSHGPPTGTSLIGKCLSLPRESRAPLKQKRQNVPLRSAVGIPLRPNLPPMHAPAVPSDNMAELITKSCSLPSPSWHSLHSPRKTASFLRMVGNVINDRSAQDVPETAEGVVVLTPPPQMDKI